MADCVGQALDIALLHQNGGFILEHALAIARMTRGDYGSACRLSFQDDRRKPLAVSVGSGHTRHDDHRGARQPGPYFCRRTKAQEFDLDLELAYEFFERGPKRSVA